ncbi:E3 ubiquitin-protein ligase [Musa troglodytarum]|uniref:RING-type E3 ubiquitin transferase n=1 Tax=Musa troglodytarum TaxID=320322 RepID=A0A9E7JA25_9LILI|nr:E3 ubiquitin-protein ligase [Musa troglodytarum]
MGNCLWCSASGKRLMTAARDGDVEEARMLLEMRPALAKHSTFGGLSSPLHVAAAGGHSEIAMMLLKHGADVNSRNIYGRPSDLYSSLNHSRSLNLSALHFKTPLMEACNNGYWEVVQTLLLYKCNVSRAEYLSGWTALHFAAQGGHIPCIRLLAADFAPAVPEAATNSSEDETQRNLPNSSYDQHSLSRFIQKTANCGITALHLAALNGNADCVHLLLDLHADVSATALSHNTSSAASIGAGSTPLHYAAYSGNLKWLPVDVARIYGRNELVPVLKPNSNQTIPVFPTSCLSLPLISILKIAREYGLHSSTVPSDDDDDSDLCAVCLENTCAVAAEGCGHEFCTRCALCLSSTCNMAPEMSAPPGSIPCPLCREGIVAFVRLPALLVKDPSLKGNSDSHSQNPSAIAIRSEFCKKQSAVVPSEAIDPISCPPHIPPSISSCSRHQHTSRAEKTSCSTSVHNGSL